MARFAAEPEVLRFPLPYVDCQGSPRWVLWPAWAFRVVAPRPRPRSTNLLQRAVLGLVIAGRRRATEIGERLVLGADLVAFILEELRVAGWLDVSFAPTPEGRSTLAEDTSEPVDEMTVGWVFVDPFTGDIWPRFHEGELPYARVERGERFGVQLQSGTLGKPHHDRAFEVRCRAQDPCHTARPAAEDILRAARNHRRHQDWQEQPTAEAPVLQSISFVLEEPASCLLATRVWLSKAGEWQVDDPFGVGQSLRLRRWIEARFATDPDLRRSLSPVVGADPEATDIQSLTWRAEEIVDDRLPALRGTPELRQRLIAMQRAVLETRALDCPMDKWDDVVIKAQRAAERAFLDIHSEHPQRVHLAGDESVNEALFDGLAQALGFEIPLPPSLSRVRRGKLLHAAEHGSGSLRSLVLLSLLGAPGVTDHPLARAARRDPRLLHKLDDLARTRDHAAHEAPSNAPTTRRNAWVEESVETIYSAIDLLFSTGPRDR